MCPGAEPCWIDGGLYLATHVLLGPSRSAQTMECRWNVVNYHSSIVRKVYCCDAGFGLSNEYIHVRPMIMQRVIHDRVTFLIPQSRNPHSVW